jgi:hypothetical protein
MGGSSQSDTKTTTQQLTPEQQSLVSLATPQYQQFAASTPTLPGAAGVAGFNPNQTAGQQSVLNSAGTAGNIVGTAGNTDQYLASGSFLDPGSNPYVQNAVKAATDPIFQNLAQSTIPGQQAAGASGSGVNYGGSREGIAEGLATQGAQRAAGQAGAGIMNTALGQGLNATLSAIGQAPTQAGAQTIPGTIQSTVGDVQQAQDQRTLDAQNQANMFAQMLPMLKAQFLTQGAAGLPGGSTTSVGQSNTDANPISQIIGGASAAGGLAGGLSKLLPLLAVV